MTEELPQQQLMDHLTRGDELQEVSITLLKEIRDKSVEVTVPPDGNLEKLVELLEEQNRIDYAPFTLTYPRDGTRLTIAAGTTTFDFLAGSVSAPGEDVADMGNSLNLQRKEFMRALSINADKDTVVRIGTSDRIPIRAGSFPIFPYKQFTTVEITVTESTELLISASTSAAAIVQMGGEVSPSTHAFTGDVYENEHTMTGLEGWDVSTAVYLRNFSVSSQETNPRGGVFKPDGSKMYVIGSTGDDINEYDLGKNWDVSTAVYLQNFSVAVQEGNPSGVAFKPDGSKMYVIGGFGDDVNEYNLGTNWDISTAVYLQNFSVAVQATSPRDIFFKPDGSKMYIIGSSNDDVSEYDLGADWDISTAVHLQDFSVAAQIPSSCGLFFKPDGSKMYVLGFAEGAVHEYDLSTDWDISTAVYLQNYPTGDDINSGNVFFKPDGSKMYVISSAGIDVQEYGIAPYRFETSMLLLRDVIIHVSVNDAVIGDAVQQRYPQSAGGELGFTSVDLSKLYFANANPANNSKINIIGVRL